MQKFKDALREEQKRLKEIIAKAKKENEHMPEGNLRISKHKNRCRYYHCVHDRNGIYIPKRNMILREQLAQKAYNSSIINIAEEQLAKINKMLEIDAAYGHFPRPSGPRSPARQGHIKRPVLRLAEPSFLRPANQCC